jgi:UDP-3-O-[3-hydroxymyristoyl] N-acetylglucosamine deacetylase
MLRGTGLHTGRLVEMTLRPAPEGTGIVFRRSGRRSAAVPASLQAVTGTAYCVTLGGRDGAQTVEHFLSAAWALGVDNLDVELSDVEVPGMDGSALPFVRAMRDVGLRPQAALRPMLRVQEPALVSGGAGWAAALPASRFAAKSIVTLDPPGCGDQAATYEESIAPARTWGYERDAELLRAQGLALGASLENTLVIGGAGFLNAPRFPNEPARHKLLDLLGDLALLGRAIQGVVIAVRSGHSLHIALARALSVQGG